MQGGGTFGSRSGISERALGRTIRTLTDDASVKAVVLRIDSPGGSALASDLLWRALMQLRAKKPLVVSVGDMAASGGYYLASSADFIYADAMSIVGSIGVVGGKFVLKDIMEKVGITTVGSLTDWLLKQVVADKKWAPTDVTAVTVGGLDATKAALKTGQIDAVVIALEVGYAMEQAREWRVISLLAPFAPDFHTHVIYARDDLIANKPDLVDRFLRAWFATIAFMRANKTRTVEITAKVLNLDPVVISRVYDEQIKMFTSDGRFEPKALAVLRQSLVEMGILQQVPEDSVMYTTRFLPVRY